MPKERRMTRLFAGDASTPPQGEERKGQEASPSVLPFVSVPVPDSSPESDAGDVPSAVRESVPDPVSVADGDDARPEEDASVEKVSAGVSDPVRTRSAGGRSPGGRRSVGKDASPKVRERCAEKTVWIPAELHAVLTRERLRRLVVDPRSSAGSLLMEAFFYWLKKNDREAYDGYLRDGLIK